MKDDWVKAALSDDSLVAELLFRLKQQSSLSVFRKPPPPSSSTSLFLPQGWGRRQPRSRFAVCATGNTGKKDSAGTTSSTIRRSPTTPLSWSGGGGGGGAAAASPSDGNCDGHSEPDRAFSDLSRSKDECTNNISSMSKSTGKRKALYVLEDEDSLPLKESIHLSKKSKMVSRPVVTQQQQQQQQQQQRVRRQNSKTIKFDTIIQRLENEMVQTSSSPSSMTEEAATTGRFEAEKYRSSPSCYAEEEQQQQQHKRCIILPDLNTIPASEGDDM